MKLFKLNLRLFDGAGATAAGGAAPTGEIQTTSSSPGKNKGAQQVVYGVQPDQPNETTQAATETKEDVQVDRKAEYSRFKQENKDLFTEDIQVIINQRFKEMKNLEKQVNDSQSTLTNLLEVLGPRYGITDGDINKLVKSIQDDTSLMEDEAMQKGLTVEQLKHFKKLERDSSELQRMQQEAEAQRGAQETYGRWLKESEEMKNVYPDFELSNELNNPETGAQFAKLLKSGVGVKAAFQAMHFDEILPSAMQLAAQKSQEATVKNIQSRNTRPAENGIASQTGVIIKNDVTKLTAADRREIARKAARGENISF